MNNETDGKSHVIGWELFTDVDSDSSDIQLISSHENFHNELNNATSYGIVLSVYATKILSGETDYLSFFGKLVSESRHCHEVYATYMSISMMSNNGVEYQKFLSKYPSYIKYYNDGKTVVEEFSGAYLREATLTAIVFACMQVKELCDNVIRNKFPRDIKNLFFTDFPDKRFEIIKNFLPEGFFKSNYKEFCSSYSDKRVIEIFQLTETHDKYYKQATQKENDKGERDFIEFIIEKLLNWLESYNCISIKYSELTAFQNEVFSITQSGLKNLIPNDEPLNHERNLLINYSSEKYYIRKKKIQASLKSYMSIAKEEYKFFIAGAGQTEHIQIITKTGRDLLMHYNLPDENVEWLNDYLLVPLVFIRVRVPPTESSNEEIILFLLENTNQLKELKSNFKGVQFITNIAFDTWLNTSWANIWTGSLCTDSFVCVLFNILPHIYFHNLSNLYNEMKIQKASVQYNKRNHEFLIFKGQDENEDNPWFILPGSHLALNVYSNYLMEYIPEMDVVQDKEFTKENSFELGLALNRFINEERYFGFNTM